jgi:hypothetical protein
LYPLFCTIHVRNRWLCLVVLAQVKPAYAAQDDTQQAIAELLGVGRSGVSRHLNNIYDEGELTRDATLAEIATVQTEGSRQVWGKVEHHNLDAILAVEYRVSSYQATQFGIWVFMGRLPGAAHRGRG